MKTFLDALKRKPMVSTLWHLRRALVKKERHEEIPGFVDKGTNGVDIVASQTGNGEQRTIKKFLYA